MKNKKRSILIACVIVIAATVVSAIFIPRITDRAYVRNYIGQDLKNVDNVALVAECPEIDGKDQSIAGVKEAVRLGADAVIVDLCFRHDSTPVITSNYENNEAADTVEQLFQELNDEKYRDIRIYFNVVQLTSLSQFNQLAVRYNMVGRIYLVGIDESHYGLVTTDNTIVPFLLKYSFTKEDLQNIEDGCFTAPACIAEYGASGLEIDVKFASAQIIDTLHDFGIPFIVSGIDSSRDFCSVLLNGATTVIVDDIGTSREIFDTWIKAMQERYSSSIEQSIKDLNNK